ncbi:MAG: U32 family peptidase [Bacteroidales bacterium]|nr:U32 family peptidase [Bacteroidales bacterium]
MTDLELLAPARNADIGIAAIDCGADAVYIAGPEFGARQDAGNSMEDVRRLCEYAHRFGVRIFLTLNTILYDSELPEAKRILEEARETGVDAVIAQDLAVFEMQRGENEILRFAQDDRGCHSEEAERPMKNLQVHASTQCAIRTPEQARLYESLGASRLVLERQLSLDQIRAIREAVSCELEFFVHGALCVCYSGNCYMSEAVAGRSANRGACVQACRSLYDLRDGNGKTIIKNKALLSLKDYNLIGRLSDLAEAGICSFKIEGRLKNISYVRNVVRAYSLALDELVTRNPGKYRRASFGRVEGGFSPDLGKTFNRGYTELFINGKRGKWSSMDAPKSVGEEVGTVIRITSGRHDAPYASQPSIYSEIIVRQDNPTVQLRNGDGFSFITKDGSEIRGFRGDICRGARIVCRDVPGLYVGARLRRNLSVSFEREMEANLPERRIPVEVSITVTASPDPDGVPAYMIAIKAKSEDGRTVEFDLDGGNETAANQERMEAMFRTQIGKAAGIYSFSMASLEVRTSDGSLPFLSAATLNGIRREIARRLDQMEGSGRPFASLRVTGDDVVVIGDDVVVIGDDVVVIKERCHPERSEGSASERLSPLSETIDYKSNISNTVARKVLRRLGAGPVEDAFELSHKKDAELMRSKYCVRHELGMCLKDSSRTGGMTGDLYLVNNGRRYRLGFDCAACEMTVSV